MKTSQSNGTQASQCIIHVNHNRVRSKKKKNKHAEIFSQEPTCAALDVGDQLITHIAINDGRVIGYSGDGSYSTNISGVGDVYTSKVEADSCHVVCEGGVFKAAIERIDDTETVEAVLRYLKLNGSCPKMRNAQTEHKISVPKDVTNLRTCLYYDPETKLIFWAMPGWLLVVDPLVTGNSIQQKICLGGVVPTAVAYRKGVLAVALEYDNLLIFNYNAASVQFIKSLADEQKSQGG